VLGLIEEQPLPHGFGTFGKAFHFAVTGTVAGLPAAPVGAGPVRLLDKGQEGPKLPRPKEAAQKAGRPRSQVGAWLWQAVEVFVYGCARCLKVVASAALGPAVSGQRQARGVVVRDPEGRMRDCYPFSTDLDARDAWVVTPSAWRWPIEVLFRASKPVMGLEAPQHGCQQRVEKLAPWVVDLAGIGRRPVWDVVGRSLRPSTSLSGR
jgi:hypothetical protein